MKKSRVFQHVDSLVSVVVETESEDLDDILRAGEEALAHTMPGEEYNRQVIENMQAGETWIGEGND